MPVGKTWAELMQEAKNAPDTEFKILDPGSYSFVIKEAKAGRSKDNTKDQIKVTASVEAGERKGATVFHNMTISPDNATALRIFFEELGALGLGDDFFATNPSIQVISNNLKGRRFVAEVTHNQYNDKTYANLKKILPPTGPAPQAGVPGPVPGAATPPPVAGPPAGNPAPGQPGYPTQAQAGYPGQPANSGFAPQAGAAPSTESPWDQAPPPPPPGL